MAKKSLIVKLERKKRTLTQYQLRGKKMPLATRIYNRCSRCGRKRGYMRKFDICRICFRSLARACLIMGVKKSSW